MAQARAKTKVHEDASRGIVEGGYQSGAETITLIYESTDSARLENQDNFVTVPQTGDVL